MNAETAKVVAASILAKGGEELSAGQQAEVNSAYEGMNTNEREATNLQANAQEVSSAGIGTPNLSKIVAAQAVTAAPAELPGDDAKAPEPTGRGASTVETSGGNPLGGDVRENSPLNYKAPVPREGEVINSDGKFNQSYEGTAVQVSQKQWHGEMGFNDEIADMTEIRPEDKRPDK